MIKDMVKYFPAQVIPGVVGFISIPIITRLFSPAEYGNYILVIVTVSILSTLSSWLPMSIIRFYPAYERDGKLDEFYANIIKLTIIWIATVSLAFMGILLFAKSHISEKIYSLIWIGIPVFIFTSGLTVLQYFLRSKRHLGWYGGSTIWQSIGTIGLGILLVVAFHFGVEGLLWGAVVSSAIALPFLWKKAVGRVSLGSKKISIPFTSKIAKYSFPLVVGNLAAWSLSLSDRYVLEFFRGSHEVGIYSVAYCISEHAIMLIAASVRLAGGPIGFKIWENEGEGRIRDFINRLTRYYLIVCVPTVVGLSILSKPAIDVFATQKYFEGHRIIPLVVLAAFFLGLQQTFQWGPILYKRTGFIMFSLVMCGLLNLGLNFLVVPQYGYVAAAITTLISYVFLLFLMITTSRRLFIWEFPFRSLAKVVCASAIMGVVVYYVGNSLTSPTLLNLVLSICLGIVVYSVMFLLLRGPQKEEIQALHNLKNRVLKRVSE